MRRYTSEPVTEDEILTCLRAAQQAPTGGNVQPQVYVVITEPEVKAKVAELYRTRVDRHERSLPDPTFRSPDDEASWRRTRASSCHLADHLDQCRGVGGLPAPDHPLDASDDEGPMDIGPLYASVYPAVQSFMVARPWGLARRSRPSSASTPWRSSRSSARRHQ